MLSLRTLLAVSINVVETLDEDSRDEGCFKNKKVFIEESSSAQMILKVSPKCSTGRSCENNAVLSEDIWPRPENTKSPKTFAFLPVKRSYICAYVCFNRYSPAKS